jgi:hypothetical protein
MKPYTEEESKCQIRKLDAKTQIVLALATNEAAWFVAGEDYFLKKYTIFPNEQFKNIVWNTPASKANFELFSHALETTSYFASNDYNKFVTGGRDGKVIVRSIQNLMSRDKHNEIEFELQTHSVIGKGVTALCLSRMG